MTNTVLVGAQFGDEGKGKVIDILSQDADYIVRFQGGDNAGHTIVIGDKKYILHLIPSGILRQDKICIIANGVVINPQALVDEIKMLKEKNIPIENRLFISNLCHIIFPYHGLWDGYRETSRGKESIGTTKRGIGPAYADKVSRMGIRLIDALDKDRFIKKVMLHGEYVNNIFQKIYNKPAIDPEEMACEYLKLIEDLKPYIADTSIVINNAINEGKNILFEGAQGALLDIDFGTYPYVTSSSTISGGACVGSGVGPNKIDKVVGVIKSYTTRVGEGPFPTEFAKDMEDNIRQEGQEFGATTGRPRRCGWLDAILVKHAVRVNGITDFAITKLDVLSKLETLKVCVAYRYKGNLIYDYPYDINILKECEPVYEEMPGWLTDIKQINNFEELPKNAKNYLKYIEDYFGVPVDLVSFGAKRSETIKFENSLPVFN